MSEHALPGGERLDALQALRAIAAGMVVFSHALGAWGAATTRRRLRTALVRAGDGSYSTYLTHTLLLGAGGHILAAVHLAGHDIPFSLGQAVGCTIAGVALYRHASAAWW